MSCISLKTIEKIFEDATMTKILRVITFIAFGLFAASFFTKSISAIDPDFGWHYRTGEFIVAHGFPRGVIYSYTMPDFPYVEQEWLIDVLTYFFYHTLGGYGLALFYTIITVSALLILFQQTQNPLTLISIIFTGGIFILQGGIRDQVVPWLLGALTLWLCSTRISWKRARYILPIIIILWVNIHGSFPFGIGIAGIYVIARSINTRHIDWQDVAVLMLCGIATLINPYTWQVWVEAWRNLSSHENIGEWMPAIYFQFNSFWTFFPFSLIFICFYIKKLPLFLLFLYGITLFMALSAIRHIPLWALIAFLLTTECLGHLQKQLSHYPGGEKIFYKIYIFLVILTVIGVGSDILRPGTYDSPLAYPDNAIAYLQAHPVKKLLFSEYNWGGYLIWKLPGTKTFVDGRMPGWQFSTQNPHESTDAYKEYLAITAGKENLQFAVNKYDIGTILWANSTSKSTLKFRQEIKKCGFKEVYHDTLTVIYET